MPPLCGIQLALFYLSLGQAIGGWIDPDTFDTFHTTSALTKDDDRDYQLVFSDEFEKDGRSFADGEDTRWTAIDKNDYTNSALHYYKSENVKTSNGVLNITTNFADNDYKAFNEKTKKFYHDTKHVQTAMVQGWNKFCLTGGIVEYSAKLPGKGATGGLWPALWLLGNLARATYVGSSNWMWPFSYNTCDLDKMEQQELSACNRVGHYGMEPGVGRGAPEIDILEAMGGDPGKLPNTPIERPYFSTSLQVAPGVPRNRPLMLHKPKPGRWYEGLEFGNQTNSSLITSLNVFFYGVKLVHEPKEYTYQSDAISANTHITEDYYTKQNIYRVEWEPPTPGKQDGYVRWYLNKKLLFGIEGHSLHITGATIPSEPMYLIMNTAVASSWGFPAPCPEGCDCKCYECGNPDCYCALPNGYCENFPASFEIDYVRVWQAVDEPKHQIGCSTKDRPTELFIKGHKERYMEKGQKEPLKPVKFGGAVCESDSDCGGSEQGYCGKGGLCVCEEGYSSSNCFSHAGFDDTPTTDGKESLEVATFYVPKGIIFIFSMLVIGISLTIIVSGRSKRREEMMMNESREHRPLRERTDFNGGISYYGGKFEQAKVKSYIMIDGRLVDGH